MVKWFKKAIKYLKSKKYKVVIVTNQSGIARGYFSIKDVYKLHRYFKDELLKYGTTVDKIYICPYHKDRIIKRYYILLTLNAFENLTISNISTYFFNMIYCIQYGHFIKH